MQRNERPERGDGRALRSAGDDELDEVAVELRDDVAAAAADRRVRLLTEADGVAAAMLLDEPGDGRSPGGPALKLARTLAGRILARLGPQAR